jgi:hypothetical protein
MPKVKSVAADGFYNSMAKTVFMPSLETAENGSFGYC